MNTLEKIYLIILLLGMIVSSSSVIYIALEELKLNNKVNLNLNNK